MKDLFSVKEYSLGLMGASVSNAFCSIISAISGVAQSLRGVFFPCNTFIVRSVFSVVYISISCVTGSSQINLSIGRMSGMRCMVACSALYSSFRVVIHVHMYVPNVLRNVCTVDWFWMKSFEIMIFFLS